MDIKITFQDMPHSDPMEKHILEKLERIKHFLKDDEWRTPHRLEFWVKAGRPHAHHRAECHLKTPQFDLHSQDEGAEMYVVIDNTIDKMAVLLNKAKDKALDKRDKPDTPKAEFQDDKYTL